MSERRETCQRGCTAIPVDGRGRVIRHAYTGGNSWGYAGDICNRSGNPSVEELVSRKARRQAKRAALVAEVLPDAPVALDAYLEQRPEYADRIADMRRAALFEYNRRNSTRHRHAVTFMAHGIVGRDSCPTTYQCRFCGTTLAITDAMQRIAAGATGGSTSHGAAVVTGLFAEHLTTCALLYLAGRLPDSPRANAAAASA